MCPKRNCPQRNCDFLHPGEESQGDLTTTKRSILVDLWRVIFKTLRGKILWRISEIFPEGEGYVCWIHSHFSTFLSKGTLFELEVELSQVSCLGQQAQPPFSPLLSFAPKWFAPYSFLKESWAWQWWFPSSWLFLKAMTPGATAVPWDGESHTWRGSFSTSVAGHHVWISIIKLSIWGDQSWCKCKVNLRDSPFILHCLGWLM